VLPVRIPVDEDGKISIAGLVERAINMMPSLTAPRTSETAIAELQQECQLLLASRGAPLADVERAL
jgi:hypothetical protein